MKNRFAFGFLLMWLVALGQPVWAHHSFNEEFNQNETIQLTGTISELEWISPHVILHLDVRERSGKVTRWAVQSLATGFFRKAGVTRKMLMGDDGKTVTMTVYKARNAAKRLGFLKKIEFPDGRSYEFQRGALAADGSRGHS